MQCLDFFRDELTFIMRWHLEIRWDFHQELLSRWSISILKSLRIFMIERIHQIQSLLKNGRNMMKSKSLSNLNQKLQSQRLKKSKRSQSQLRNPLNLKQRPKLKSLQKLTRNSLISQPITVMILGNTNGLNPSMK